MTRSLGGILLVILSLGTPARADDCALISAKLIKRFRIEALAERATWIQHDLNNDWYPPTISANGNVPAWIGSQWKLFNRAKPELLQTDIVAESKQAALLVAALEPDINALCGLAVTLNKELQIQGGLSSADSTSNPSALNKAGSDVRTSKDEKWVERTASQVRFDVLKKHLDKIDRVSNRLVDFLIVANDASPNDPSRPETKKKLKLLDDLRKHNNSLVSELLWSMDARDKLDDSVQVTRWILQLALADLSTLKHLNSTGQRGPALAAALSAERRDKQWLWAVTDGEIFFRPERAKRYLTQLAANKLDIDAAKTEHSAIALKEQIHEAQKRLKAMEARLEKSRAMKRRLLQ